MKYTKVMIDLIKAARQRLPSDQKPSIKLANPEVFNELATHYMDSKDHVFRALVKEVLELAGLPVKELSIKEQKLAITEENKMKKGFDGRLVYRGRVVS